MKNDACLHEEWQVDHQVTSRNSENGLSAVNTDRDLSLKPPQAPFL